MKKFLEFLYPKFLFVEDVVSLHFGGLYPQPQFPPQYLLIKSNQEQIEQEGGIEEFDSLIKVEELNTEVKLEADYINALISNYYYKKIIEN
ncbi:MAG: hypothetical protein EZS28_028465 [Streblomastix strix]|uniref:Uncharacterized protein n=1 Tax=Streblomastix strix TaxID=222440 RepID=A0A5J4V075_9EUKA|nr:MAG: hypothetical protein EZS28_028465 [Streblomastix strix]